MEKESGEESGMREKEEKAKVSGERRRICRIWHAGRPDSRVEGPRGRPD